MDQRSWKTVAIKVPSKPTKSFQVFSENEAKFLKLLQGEDSHFGTDILLTLIVDILDEFFVDEGELHLRCLVLEHLHKNLYQLLRETSFQGLPLDIVRIIAY